MEGMGVGVGGCVWGWGREGEARSMAHSMASFKCRKLSGPVQPVSAFNLA